MYLPPHFAQTEPEALHALMQAHPLGTLVVDGPDGLEANHLPFLFDASQGPKGALLAHVARANRVWQHASVDGGIEALVVFRGVEGYISPNWYPSKHETHRQVPTWNYEVVHVRGRLHARDDERYVRGVVAKLTRLHEASQPQPWKMGDAPADYLDGMLAAIVGLELRVDHLIGKAKLSQNKAAADRDGAADGVAGRGLDALARAMRRASGGAAT